MTHQIVEIQKTVSVTKTFPELGLVFGPAVCCEIKTADGTWHEYEDLHGDIIRGDDMLKGALEFVLEHGSKMGGMHQRDGDGQVIKTGTIPFVMPLTHETYKAFGITGYEMTMLACAGKPDAQYLPKYLGDDPEWKAFSIGCTGIRVPA